MVDASGYAGTQMIPSANALLSLLTLKLLDKERLSHIKRKSDTFAAVRSDPLLHGFLAKADGQVSTMAVLRFEAHDVRRIITDRAEEGCFIRDDSSSWQQHSEADRESACDRMA